MASRTMALTGEEGALLLPRLPPRPAALPTLPPPCAEASEALRLALALAGPDAEPPALPLALALALALALPPSAARRVPGDSPRAAMLLGLAR
jgi:hypothetical protein